MDKNQSVRKDILEMWKRYVNDSYTCEDLARILDYVKGEEHLQEFIEVFEEEWNIATNDLPTTPEDRKKAYREEAAQFLAAYERMRKMHPTLVPLQNTGRFRKIWYAAAAALLLGLLVPAAYLYMKPKTERTEQIETVVQYVEEVTERGEIKIIFLPDQTKVTLNAESNLRYPADFAGERSVELQGGAIFDVTPDSERPFTVATTDMNVRVLGTVFDVKAYPDDELSIVSVASGKVSVETGRAPSHQNNRTTSILLEP